MIYKTRGSVILCLRKLSLRESLSKNANVIIGVLLKLYGDDIYIYVGIIGIFEKQCKRGRT